MSVVLVNHQGLKLVSGIQIQTPSPPIGLAYIGAYIKSNGYGYTAIDACGEGLDKITKSQDDENLLIQGLSIGDILEKIPNDVRVVGLTSLFSHAWFLVHNIASAIRSKFPRVLIVVGGEHPNAMPESVLRSSDVDIVIFGEGEETFLELLNKVYSGGEFCSIDGIAYISANNDYIVNKKRQRIRSIDGFPYPDWDNWSIESYIEYGQVTGINLGRAIPILGSRGCPYECNFCSNKDMWTKRYLMRSGKSIVDEMKYLKEKYSLSVFNFMDSTFIINRNKIIDFCQVLIDSGLNIEYQLPAGTRSEALTSDVISLLEQSGLKNIALAPESGSEYIRDIVKKRINYGDFLKTVSLLRKSDITSSCFIVIGFPEDTYFTLKETLWMVRKLAILGIDDITVSQFTPYPGSVYYNELLQQGKILEGDDTLKNIVSFYSNKPRNYSHEVKSSDLYRIMLRMYTEFYVLSFILRPWRVIYNFYIYLKSGRENTKYVKLVSELFFVRRRFNRDT